MGPVRERSFLRRWWKRLFESLLQNTPLHAIIHAVRYDRRLSKSRRGGRCGGVAVPAECHVGRGSSVTASGVGRSPLIDSGVPPLYGRVCGLPGPFRTYEQVIETVCLSLRLGLIHKKGQH